MRKVHDLEISNKIPVSFQGSLVISIVSEDNYLECLFELNLPVS